MKQKITMRVVEKFVAKHPNGRNRKAKDGKYTYFNRGAESVFVNSDQRDIVKFDDPNEVRPGCLFGHIIASLGGGPELVSEGTSIGAQDVLSTKLSDTEVYILRSAQRQADSGETWKASLETAKNAWGLD